MMGAGLGRQYSNAAFMRVEQAVPTLAELVRWYIDTFESISKWQRSKQTHLKFQERHALGKFNPLSLTWSELIDHLRSRRASGAGPARSTSRFMATLVTSAPNLCRFMLVSVRCT